jgi:hypothetical protein
MRRRPALALAILLGAGSLAAPITFGAAPPLRVEHAAPRGSVEQQIAWAHVAIDYGRPEMHGRAIFGELVPYDRVWRLGEDEATRLTTDANLTLGSLAVPAGRYALFAIPRRHSWTLIVNRVADQWGAWNWSAAQDLGRVELPVEPVEPAVEALTFELLPTGDKEATLSIRWEGSAVSVPLSVAGEPPAPPPSPPPAPSSKPKSPGAHAPPAGTVSRP